MSLREVQNLLARLYTESELRQTFLSSPEKIARQFNLSQREIEELSAIFPDELNFFAESLLNKRLREVEKLLPQTKHFLSVDFEKYFREFSSTFLPVSIKKHLEDAVRFAEFLTTKIEAEWLQDLIRYEQANLIFNGYGKSFFIRRFNFNIKEISREGAKAQRKITVAVWFKFGRKTGHFVW